MVTLTVKAGDPPPPMPESPARSRGLWASCGATWGALAGVLAQGARMVGGADYTITTTYDVLGWELFTHRTPMADIADAVAFDAAVITAIAVGFGAAGAAAGLAAGLAARWLRLRSRSAEPGAAADGGA